MVRQGEGLTRVESRHSVEETIRRVQQLLESKGVKIFALIDHSGEATNVGMDMRPTKLLIFGAPKAGTPLMLAAPSVAIDLPLKLLVAEEESGRVWLTWNDPEYLRARHAFPEALVANLSGVAALLQKAAE